jgi:hypothetical protein
MPILDFEVFTIVKFHILVFCIMAQCSIEMVTRVSEEHMLPSPGSNAESRILHNKDLRDLCTSPSITLRWAGYVDRIGKARNACRILMRKNYGKHSSDTKNETGE